MQKSNNSISHTVTYKNGRFYTTDNKRLVFSENKIFEITGNKTDFLDTDEMLETHPVRSPDVMKEFVEKKYGEENVIFMLPAGTKFCFHFGLGKKKKDVPQRKYGFEGEFQEDVYLYKIKNAPVEIPESWRIEECITSIETSTDRKIELSEPIIADSPNAVFAMLIGTHFDRQRSTGIKVYDYFKVEIQASETLFHTNEKDSLSLGQLRERMLHRNIERIKAQIKAKAVLQFKETAKKLIVKLGGESL
jgi:hypothetical protein